MTWVDEKGEAVFDPSATGDDEPHVISIIAINEMKIEGVGRRT